MLKLKGINYKLYLSMLVFAFLPTIYSTLRIFYLGNIPNEWTFSIAGQLSWVSLLYEILTEAIILPLFFFIGKNIEKKDKILNLVKTGLVISFILNVQEYSLLYLGGRWIEQIILLLQLGTVYIFLSFLLLLHLLLKYNNFYSKIHFPSNIVSNILHIFFWLTLKILFLNC